MRQRKHPFGYIMKNGRLEAEPQEAETVSRIFTRYAAGASFAKLSWELNQQDVPYQAGKPWNKNMVARILADVRYLGTDEHPPLVQEGLFQAAGQTRPGRYQQCKRGPAVKELQSLAECPICGCHIKRYSHQHGRERWQCPECKTVSPQVSDKMLLENAVALLNQLISDATQVIEPPNHHCNSLEVMRLQNQLERELEKSGSCDEDIARGLVRSITATRFAALEALDYESERIRYLLDRAEPSAELDVELLKSIAAAVRVHPQGEVSLRLRNNQIIEGS